MGRGRICSLIIEQNLHGYYNGLTQNCDSTTMEGEGKEKSERRRDVKESLTRSIHRRKSTDNVQN